MKVKRIAAVDGLGWHPPGSVVLEHPALGRIVHVAICDDAGNKRWDQWLHLEPVGAITVPVNARGELGLVTVDRPGVRSASDYTWPDLDFEKLGVPSIEFPRGFPQKGESGQETAVRETSEELGVSGVEVRQIGECTPNTTFHPHRIPIYLARLTERFTGTFPPDVNEKIFRVEWRSLEQVNALLREGAIWCGMTKAALAQYRAVVGC